MPSIGVERGVAENLAQAPGFGDRWGVPPILDEDTAGRETDLDFLTELRAADLRRLCELKVNLGARGPRWMRVAVERAIARRAFARPRLGAARP